MGERSKLDVRGFESPKLPKQAKYIYGFVTKNHGLYNKKSPIKSDFFAVTSFLHNHYVRVVQKRCFADYYDSFEPKNIKALHSIIDSFFHVFFCSYLYTIHDFHFYSISISSTKPKIQTFHLSSKSSDYLSLSKDYKKDILRFPRQDITFVNRKVSSNSEPLLGRFGLDE